MTRFARGGNGGKKRPLDATQWDDLKSGQKTQQDTSDDKTNNKKKRGAETTNSDKKHDNSGTKHTDREKVCYNCQKTGHMAFNCPSGSKVKYTQKQASPGDVKERWTKEKRSEWRRQKRQRQKDTKKCCFNCRKPGHQLSECPEVRADNEQGTGICFKCGSTEHSSSSCRIKIPAGEFPYAKCFVCGETGHLSRQCPDNPRGLYPNGGCCNMCASVEHLKKDCPEFQKEQGIGDMTVERLATVRSIDAEVVPSPTVPQKTKQKQPKVVKF